RAWHSCCNRRYSERNGKSQIGRTAPNNGIPPASRWFGYRQGVEAVPVKRVLAIADDLTGALEVGALFAAAGMRSVVTAGEKEVFDDPVVVIDTETRHASCAEAESIVEKKAAGWPSLVYKKTDSTLRGNIGAELRALHRLYGGPIAYVPAY